MIISYFRSSSYNAWSYCEQKYFMSYVLGHQEQSNQKADMGTIAHKTLEVLAALKKYAQDNPKATKLITLDDAIGEVECEKSEFLTPYHLTDDEVAKVNKSRINKTIYKTPCQIQNGHTIYGKELVQGIMKRAYDYYKTKYDHHNWTHLHFRDIHNWCWMALDHDGGLYDPRNRKIVEPERRFDITIDKPWANFKYGKFDGQLSIKGTIDLITQVDNDTYEIIDWKGLPLETSIPTPSGWTTMGELSVGDIVFDKDGRQTTVIAKSQVKHIDCYRITFDDTSTIECDDEHLWLLEDNTVISIQNLKEGDSISVSKPIETNKTELPIDPYVLGVWLGDGRCRSGEITSSDQFIFDKISKHYRLGEDISGRIGGCEQRTPYGLTTELRKLGLLNNKHIPQIYLRASISQRLAILRGLMDTDGNVNSVRKQAVFTSCNKRLSDDTKELLLSLGQRPLQSTVYNKQHGRDIAVYPISFRPIDINPFLLPAKAEKISSEWGCGKSHKRTVKKIEQIEKKNTQCISVDSDSRTYLCGRNMIPTHNTGQRLDWATGEQKSQEKLNADPQLMLYYYAAKSLYPDKEIILTIFFIRDGGPFSVCFDEEHIAKMESLLQERYETIRDCEIPKLLDPRHKDFRCERLCHFYKTKWPGTNTNMCDHIHKEIKTKGIEQVTKLHKAKGHSFDTYNAPGE